MSVREEHAYMNTWIHGQGTGGALYMSSKETVSHGCVSMHGHAVHRKI